MNYHNISHNDIWNGEGIRTVLFVSGCNHNCPGCQNPQTHDLKSGILFDKKAMLEIIQSLDDPYIDGLTISGGDPLHPDNISSVENICRLVKLKYPNKSIWIYTGYTFNEAYSRYKTKYPELFNNIDVIVDGPFIKELASRDYPYAGSTNQKIYRKRDNVWYLESNL